MTRTCDGTGKTHSQHCSAHCAFENGPSRVGHAACPQNAPTHTCAPAASASPQPAPDRTQSLSPRRFQTILASAAVSIQSIAISKFAVRTVDASIGSPGAGVGQSRCTLSMNARCSFVACRRRASPGADGGPIPAQIWVRSQWLESEAAACSSRARSTAAAAACRRAGRSLRRC